MTNCGDIRIGIEGDFRLGLNEVAIKMPLLSSGSKWHGHASPRRRCQKPLWGWLYTSAEAVTAGYLDRVVPGDQLLTEAFAVAEQWGAYDRHAFSETKKRLRGATIQYIEETLEGDLEAFKSPVV